MAIVVGVTPCPTMKAVIDVLRRDKRTEFLAMMLDEDLSGIISQEIPYVARTLVKRKRNSIHVILECE